MAIVIDLKMTNSGTTRALDRLEKAMDRLDAILNRINKAIGAAASGTDSLANRISRATGGGRSAGPGRTSTKRAPFATWQDEADWLKKQPGWRSQARAEALRKRMTPKSPAEEMMAVMMRTRFGFSGGKFNAMPLGRDLMGKFGPQLMQMMMGGGGIAGKAGGLLAKMGIGGAQTGGVGAATGALSRLAGPIGVVMAAFTALAAVTTNVISYMRELANQQTLYGGTAGQSAAAGRLARITGASVGNFSGNLGHGVTQAGINPLGGPYGDMNYSEKFLKAAKYVAMAKTLEEARKRAAQMNDPNLANIHNQDPETKKWLFNKTDSAGEEFQAKASRIMARIDVWIEKFKNKAAQILAPIMTVLDGITRAFDSMITRIDKFFNALIGWLNILTGGAFGGKEQKKSPIEKNTEGLQELTRTMKETREILGGGNRAQGSLPGKLRGNTARERDGWQLNDIRLSNL